MIHVLVIAFFLSFFMACVVENDKMPKEEKYRWFAVITGLVVYVYLTAFVL